MTTPATQRHQLAQANVARLRAPVGSPLVAEFVAAVDRINALAERSAGFVWRHHADGGHVVTGAGELVVINLSVWQSYAHLHEFVYRSGHAEFVRRRSEWFDRMAGPTTVLWWVRSGVQPTLADAQARLRHVGRYGPLPAAFTLRCQFDADGRRIRRAKGERSKALAAGA